METIGSKIKRLRQKKGWTINMLAERIGCTDKSIIRYENNQSSPEMYYLIRLSLHLEVSADYLLGLSERSRPQIKQQKIFNEINELFFNEPNLQNNYYWITYYQDLFNDTITAGGQTEWVGFTDTIPKKELRVLRSVIPDKAIDICTKVYGRPMVINTMHELQLYLQFGGHAIIKASLIQKYLPFLLEPIESEIRYGI